MCDRYPASTDRQVHPTRATNAGIHWPAFTLMLVLVAGCATGPEKQQAERWSEADIDGNGVLTMAEFEKSKLRWTMRFDMVDQNEDGRISHDEYRHYNRISARQRSNMYRRQSSD